MATLNDNGKACGNFADLHVHTNYSDGTFSPEKVVETALGLGLKVIAITDHDCVEGVTPSIEAASGKDLEVIPGIEISAAIGDKEIHVLGYFIDWHEPSLVNKLEVMKENRKNRMVRMVELLQGEGLDIDKEEVFSTVAEGTIGRPHIAHVLKAKGLVHTIQEAFNRYLADGRSCFVKHVRLEYYEAIEMILKSGGVPVIGHPGISNIEEYMPDIISAGIKGIEVFHADHAASDSDRYLRMAQENSLIVTGGSDCHGSKKGKVLMGSVSVGPDVVEALRAESAKIRGA